MYTLKQRTKYDATVEKGKVVDSSGTGADTFPSTVTQCRFEKK